MKITAEVGAAHHIAPYLDGKYVENCVAADDFEGYVVVHKRGADGSFVLDNGRFALETLRGVVEMIDTRVTPKTDTRPLPPKETIEENEARWERMLRSDEAVECDRRMGDTELMQRLTEAAYAAREVDGDCGHCFAICLRGLRDAFPARLKPALQAAWEKAGYEGDGWEHE